MLDVAWGLFELGLLRDPELEPNALWTDITSGYLHIVPHSEWSGWFMRVQLSESPGFMLNYGLGTALAAELRARTVAGIGGFDGGNERWFAWLSDKLLGEGVRLPTSTTLTRFLGTPPSPAATVKELREIRRQPDRDAT
jgi:hypothetical protein